MKNLPSQIQMDYYYSLFREGYSASEIQQKFTDRYEIPKKFYEKNYLPIFFNYTRVALRAEMSEEGVISIPLTEGLEENLLQMIHSGLSLDHAAKLLNIPLATITEIWYKDYPYLKTKVQFATEVANARVVQALHKRATGYVSVLKSKTITTMKDKDGNEITNTSTSFREEQVAPSVDAAKFWLINKASDNWSQDGSINKEGNKSRILEAIDQMTQMSIEDKSEIKE